MPGFKKNVIRPAILKDLAYARASYESVYGTIVSDWKKEPNGVLSLAVTVPPNTTADVSVPKFDYNTKDWVIQESQGLCWQKGAYVSGIPGIAGGADDGECITFNVGAGRYIFRAGVAGAVGVVSH